MKQLLFNKDSYFSGGQIEMVKRIDEVSKIDFDGLTIYDYTSKVKDIKSSKCSNTTISICIFPKRFIHSIHLY